MKYKRNEAFRFEFGEPVPVIFSIRAINGKEVESSDGEAEMLDLSLNGMKIATSLEIPVDRNQVQVTTAFKIVNREYKINGELVWIDKVFDKYHYGVHFNLNESTQENLLDDLKVIGKKLANQ
ncbi:PilZ domain-containing protein [Ornithinibacillus halophilus]|uniref:PilZ domain-containing protein n=1 Tax=Ornithinibacillus halophilus TaxID=930117 RepID=A0A1M5F5R6_9BACI|nr:PilZ domain-containing protein [Ornithinibacillus halophilus]SHF86883.1 PilZ domain-containing protein [Ornithinibacillus halophilus]